MLVGGTESAVQVAKAIRRYISHVDVVEADGGDIDALRQMAEDLEAELPTFKQLRHESYYELVLALLRMHGGNVSAAARYAKTDRKHFHHYVVRFAIDLTTLRSSKVAKTLRLAAFRKRATEARHVRR